MSVISANLECLSFLLHGSIKILMSDTLSLLIYGSHVLCYIIIYFPGEIAAYHRAGCAKSIICRGTSKKVPRAFFFFCCKKGLVPRALSDPQYASYVIFRLSD